MQKFAHLAAAALFSLGLVWFGLTSGQALAIGSSSTPAAKQDSNYVEAKKLADAGNYAEAIPLLEKTVAANPANADAYNYLGYSHRKLGDKEAALTFYTKALEIDPEHLGANEYLGELYLELNQLAKAEERLRALDSACFFGCEEYRDLKESIAKYRAKTGS